MSANVARSMVWLKSAGIFLYFAIATVWVPSRLLTGPLRLNSQVVQDIVAVGTWGFALVLGMWGLRYLQRRGLI